MSFEPRCYGHGPCTLPPCALAIEWDDAETQARITAEAESACNEGLAHYNEDLTAGILRIESVKSAPSKCREEAKTAPRYLTQAVRSSDEWSDAATNAVAQEETGYRATRPGRSQPTLRRRWSPDEEERFLKALKHFGKDINIHAVDGRVSVQLGPTVAEVMSIMVKTRSASQVRSHVQKHFIRLEREASRAGCG